MWVTFHVCQEASFKTNDKGLPATSCLWMCISGKEYYTALKVKYNQGYKQQHG